MTFQSFQPIESLRPYIQHYLYVKADGSTDTMTPPEGDPRFVDGLHQELMLPSIGSLFFVRGAEVCTDQFHIEDNHGIYILGPRIEPLTITTLHGWFEAVHVDFNPGGMRALLGYDMHNLKGKVVGTQEVNDLSLSEMGLRIKKETMPKTCVTMLNGFFLGRLQKRLIVNESIISRVVDALDKSKGTLTVSQMCDVACMSERQFRRVFSEYVGLSPKEFVRLRRFHLALQFLQRMEAKGQKVNSLEVAINFGYYDTSHMAAEFRAMGCTSPMQFRKLGIVLKEDFSLFFG